LGVLTRLRAAGRLFATTPEAIAAARAHIPDRSAIAPVQPMRSGPAAR
jgi:SulP family sulfate permease